MSTNIVNAVVVMLMLSMANICFSAVDPMRPPEYMASSGPQKIELQQPLILQMVLVSGERKFAVINSKAVTEGGVIYGAKVVSINSDHVVVKRKGKVVDLRMNSIKNVKGMAR